MLPTLLTALFLFPAPFTIAQTCLLPVPVQAYLSAQCAVCRESNAQAGQLTVLQRSFHEILDLLAAQQADKAYTRTVSALAQPGLPADTLVLHLLQFLQARMLYARHLYSPALQAYRHLRELFPPGTPLHGPVLANLGELYLELEKPDSAYRYLSAYLALQDTTDRYTLRNVYSNAAICLLDSNRSGETHGYLQKSIALSVQLKDTPNLAKTYLNLANQYYVHYRDREALRCFGQGLRYARASGDLESQENACLNLAIVEEQRGNTIAALRYRKEYERLHDSLYNRDQVWNLAQQEKNALLKYKELQFHSEQQEAALQAQAVISRRQAERNTFVLLAAAFGIFFLFALAAYRNARRQNRIIRAQRETLAALNHTKDQLFSVVAHDLRSPVQTLKVTLARLRQALANGDVDLAGQVAGEIEALSNRTYALLNNLLYWAMSQTGQLHLAQDDLNVRRLVDQVLHDYLPVAATKSIVLENCVAENLYCRGDLPTIKIILRNLVDNAIKFSAPCTPVVVSGRTIRAECVVSVADAGQGIAADVVQALSNGQTGKTARQAGNHSTGLGLWLVKTMAERNGGRLQVEPRATGTCINIHLPQCQHHAASQDTAY